MEPEVTTALTLLLTGMLTVFVVLFLVVITGNLLIQFVNKYFPESKAAVKGKESGIANNKIAAINAAVEIFTEGKARVLKIENKQ